MEKLNLDKHSLKKFGITMGLILAAITGVIALKQKASIMPTGILSAAFILVALVYPQLLKLVYIFWMRLAFVLSWLNSRLILIVLFYLVFTPIRLVLSLFGTDLLDKKLEKGSNSYWKKKEDDALNQGGYEKQY